MENWGAISFQANRLLVDPSSSSFGARDTFETIGHEIAHQWFGNLVTMTWWTDVWLNESFASLLETKISEKLDPLLDARADFFLRVAGMAAAIDGDSLRSTHPVRTVVERPEEIGQIFDEISYGKGSSILAMLDAYLGEDRFRAGVTDYLDRFRYGNARTEDLWDSLGRVSGEPVRAIAGPWIDRPGLPVVSARLCDGGLELTQRRFTYFGIEDAQPWPIPMMVDVDGRTERVMLQERSRTVPVPSGATVHLNPGAVGFYRTLYDLALYDRLLERLPTRPAPDRWIVLEDLAAFLVSGDVGWSTYERFAKALGESPDRLVVESLTGTLVPLSLAFPKHPDLSSRARSFLTGQYARLGPVRRDGEPASDRILRERVAFARARVDLEFARELSARFGEWESLDPDLRLATAVGHARAGGAEGYRALRTALDRTPSEADRIRLVRGLGWAADPGQLRETLEFAVAGGVNRSYLTGLILQSSMNPAGRPEVWSWLTQRVETLAEVFRGSGYLPIVLESTTPYLGLGREAEVRSFFDGHSQPEGTRGIAKGLERLEVLERLGRHLAGGPPRARDPR
jgi:tricorn protease interacting factor F2/3